MQAEVVFCNLISERYRRELLALKTLIIAPITLWQFTKSRLTTLEKVTYVAILNQVIFLEEEMEKLLLIDSLYRSAAGQNLCQVLYNSPNLLDCILTLSQFGLSTLPAPIKTAIRTDYATLERYVCNLGFRELLVGNADQALLDISASLLALKNRLINEFGIDDLLATYQALLESTEISMDVCNTDTYNVLEYFDYLNSLAVEASNICHLAGVKTDAQDLKAEAKRLSLAQDSDGSWVFSLDSSFSSLSSNVDGLQTKIDDLIARAAVGANTNPYTIPKDKLMK